MRSRRPQAPGADPVSTGTGSRPPLVDPRRHVGAVAQGQERPEFGTTRDSATSAQRRLTNFA